MSRCDCIGGSCEQIYYTLQAVAGFFCSRVKAMFSTVLAYFKTLWISPIECFVAPKCLHRSALSLAPLFFLLHSCATSRVPKPIACCSPPLSLLPSAHRFAIPATVSSSLSHLAEGSSAPSDPDVTTTSYCLPRNSKSTSLSLQEGNHFSTLKSRLGIFFFQFSHDHH